MGMIFKDVVIIGSKGTVKTEALFDTGAFYSFISKDMAEQVEVITPLPAPKTFKLANENTLKITETIRTDFEIDGVRMSDEFMVADNLSVPVIIGTGTMQKWDIKVNPKDKKVVVSPNTLYNLLV